MSRTVAPFWMRTVIEHLFGCRGLLDLFGCVLDLLTHQVTTSVTEAEEEAGTTAEEPATSAATVAARIGYNMVPYQTPVHPFAFSQQNPLIWNSAETATAFSDQSRVFFHNQIQQQASASIKQAPKRQKRERTVKITKGEPIGRISHEDARRAVAHLGGEPGSKTKGDLLQQINELLRSKQDGFTTEFVYKGR